MQNLLTVASFSITLGVIFNLIVRGVDPGIGLFIFMLGVITSALLITRRLIPRSETKLGTDLILIALIILITPLIRSNIFATVLYILLLPASMLSLLDRFGYRKPIDTLSGLFEMMIGLITLPFSFVYSLLKLVSGELWKKGSLSKLPIGWKNVPQIIIGIILAIPAIFIFSALFSSADPAFERLLSLEEILNWLAKLEIWASFDDVIVIVFVTLILMGWFAMMLAKSDPLQSAILKLKRPVAVKGYAPMIFSTFFTLLSVLFGLFVLVQTRYLFGGSEQVISESTGLTFAQYARRGFLELLISSALVVGLATILLGTVERSKLTKKFITPYYILIGLTLIIALSAHYRLYITEQFYGLTNIRFTGHVLMLGVMAMLILLIRAVSAQRLFHYLNRYTLYILLLVIIPLVVLPTDRLVAMVNWDRYKAGENFDLAYNLNLSDEAVALNIKRAEASNSDTIELITKAHYARRFSTEQDWRSWNLYTNGIAKYENELGNSDWKGQAEDDLANFISEYSGALKNKNPQLIKEYWSDAVEYEQNTFKALDDLVVLGYTPIEIPDFNEWYLLSYDALGVPDDWYGLYIPMRFSYKAEDRSSGAMVEQCMNDALYVRLERGEWRITTAEVVWFGELELNGDEWVHSAGSIPKFANQNNKECQY